ncbi:hypothetical protein MUN82_04605 [Hymenobacter aerilatus]|uniref:Uncharacterized protein n=1 Tax=Hymenobacter aerilatus TaxID=2932251 RepID=A0A8T9T332_9BACT|nr:hypothetical protein [Hymenobacter aerilatus]UOR06379.1 hypothetical protein MUN82_04605 [Hymenobacter aerilatus]
MNSTASSPLALTALALLLLSSGVILTSSVCRTTTARASARSYPCANRLVRLRRRHQRVM